MLAGPGRSPLLACPFTRALSMIRLSPEPATSAHLVCSRMLGLPRKPEGQLIVGSERVPATITNARGAPRDIAAKVATRLRDSSRPPAGRSVCLFAASPAGPLTSGGLGSGRISAWPATRPDVGLVIDTPCLRPEHYDVFGTRMGEAGSEPRWAKYKHPGAGRHAELASITADQNFISRRTRNSRMTGDVILSVIWYEFPDMLAVAGCTFEPFREAVSAARPRQAIPASRSQARPGSPGCQTSPNRTGRLIAGGLAPPTQTGTRPPSGAGPVAMP